MTCKRSMKKCVKIIRYIWNIPRFYTNLRVLGDYSGIFEKFSNEMRKNACPLNGSYNIKTFTGILSFLWTIQIEQNTRERYFFLQVKIQDFSENFVGKQQLMCHSRLNLELKKFTTWKSYVNTLWYNPKTKLLTFDI